MYRLVTHNRQFCRDALAAEPGFALHGLEQYGPADRKAAASSFRLGSPVGVIAVVADSPADRAGLRADDQLISVNGRKLPSLPTDATTPTNARVKATRNALLAEMAEGEVSLVVARADGERVVRFTADVGCRSTIELVPGDVVNASADGQSVIISAGLLERCATDGDLAFVIAHELAHNLLHHPAKLTGVGASEKGLLSTSKPGTAGMRRTEEDADRLGASLAMAAGYDLGSTASFLRSLPDQGDGDATSSTHPALGRRLALLAAVIADFGSSSPSGDPVARRVASTAAVAGPGKGRIG
jgi:hypothetical protein